MGITNDGNAWCIERLETTLDAFVHTFVSLLEKHGIRYVLVSGYVAILFGRSRNSEDVDVFVEKLSAARFEKFWADAIGEFECINAAAASDALNDYLLEGIAVRFCRKGEVIPNMEVRFPRTALDVWTLSNSVTCLLNGRRLAVSPLELQIPFKLYLGSDKDFEDARHLWLVTKEHLNLQMLNGFVRRLGQEKNAETWLK